MEKSKNSFRWMHILNILGGALILTYPALRNRFPLINSDTGTYLLTALTNVVPTDRPVYYGYFISWTDVYDSLWFVVYAQNILLAILIWKTMKKFSPGFSIIGFYLVIIALTSLTAMAWFSSQIMTDVFTSLLLLSLALLLIDRTMGYAEMIFLILVFFFCCLVHYSHFMLAAAVAGCIAFFKLLNSRYFRDIPFSRIILTVCIIASAIIFVFMHNFSREGKFYFSKGSSVLFTSKLVENGLLKKYLDAHCHEDPSPLCAYKDRLPTWGAPFLYGDESAVNIIGVDKVQAECSRLNNEIMKAYPLPLLLLSVKGAAINLFRVEAGTGIRRYDENSAPYAPLKKQDPTEFVQWQVSVQEQNGLHFELLTIIQRIFIYVTLIILLFNLYSSVLVAQWNRPIISFARVILLALLFNALITGALASEHDDRYQTRIAWIIPFIVLIQYHGAMLNGATLILQRWNNKNT